jgi:exosortase E/protease (VPEID-CTERM system)
VRLGSAARFAILASVFLAEKVLLNEFVDFHRAQSAQGFGSIVHDAQHWGFRFLIALAAALTVFAYVRGGARLRAAAASMRAQEIDLRWTMAHVLLLATLMPLTYLLYPNGTSAVPFEVMFAMWMALGAAAVLAALLAIAPWSIWIQGARALGAVWCYALVAALVGVCVTQWSQRLWKPAAGLTFDLVRRLLSPILPTLIVDPINLVLGTNRFAVQITDVCSGLEGMGLMLAFCIAWLVYFRRDYIFPRALLLVPAGMLASFALNALRIAALVLIGHAGFPEVASFGFHSQAGWIAFIAISCGVVFASRSSTWLNRAAVSSTASVETENPTAAYVMPLLAILVAGTVSHAMASDFEWLDPLRLIAGVTVLALYRRKLATLDWRCSWRGPTVGLAVFLVWIAAANLLVPGAAIPLKLAALPESMRVTWIASRIAASVLTVPIAEELAYRGFLMRRLISKDFESVPFRSVGWLALSVTAVAFGLLHGVMWLPAIVAGLAYGIVLVRRGSIGEAVVAHATTNALIAGAVLGWDQWQLWR